MRCDTCKHWGPAVTEENWDGDPRYPGMRECKRIPFGPDLLEEMRRKQELDHPHAEDLPGMSLPPEQLAVTTDGSGYAGGIYTRAAFGCVLHEQRED